MHLMNHYNIGIPWILTAQREANHKKLQHASRPWIAKSPSQIIMLQECRLLTNPEWIFRKLTVSYKKAYWQKRYTVNRVKFGDEYTKFFHAMATVSYRIVSYRIMLFQL